MTTATDPPTVQTLASRRAEQARREIGQTDVARPVAWLLVILVGIAVVAPTAVQTALDLAAARGPLPALAPLADLERGLGGFARGPLALNESLRSAIERSEDRLEDESWLRARLLPPTQRFLTGVLGQGNEQTLAGAGGWWYLADDFRHVTGRGFLAPEVLRRRERDDGVAADPVPALAALAGDLERRGVDLLVVPVPAKPTVVPRPLSRRDTAAPVHNPSFGRFLERLTAAGVAVYDPTPDLLAVAAADGRPFLRTDTHWTPAGLDRVAVGIARRLRAFGVTGRPDAAYRRRATITGRGDLTALLALPPGSRVLTPETVEVEIVRTADGEVWRPTRGAEVLLLGDSFSNVYSESGLGWGTGAGLGEQLSFHLGAPVDRIALNAGGALETRVRLSMVAQEDPERLTGKRVVVYQFAARELSIGDWRVLAGL